MNKFLFYFLLLFLFNLSCSSFSSLSLKDIRNIPVKRMESHSIHLDKKITERVSPPPAIILQFLKEMDSTDKYEAYNMTGSEKKLLEEYFQLLPAAYRDLLEKKVVAIYLVKNFIGGGMADYLFNGDGEMYIALYLNPEIFHVSLNDWIRYRDNSAFVDDGSAIKIEPELKSGYMGLLHTLIHEASHIYDYYNHVTPYVEREIMLVNNMKENTEFTEDIWREHSAPVDKYNFKGRDSIYPYGLGKSVNIAESVELYQNLNWTPFSSLYASKNWSEDFAELFTWYYLSRKLKINYTVKIVKNGDEIVIFSPLKNQNVTRRFFHLDKIK